MGSMEVLNMNNLDEHILIDIEATQSQTRMFKAVLKVVKGLDKRITKLEKKAQQ